MKTKDFVLSILFIISILIIYSLFPASGVFQQIIVMLVFFGIIPILFNKIILKNSLNVFKIQTGNWKQGIIWGGISFFISVALFFLSLYFIDFFRKRGVPETILFDFKKFVFYEVILVLPVIFIYDLFFRGFVISISEIKLKYWSVVLQAVLFIGLVFGSGSFSPAIIPFLINAPLAGWVAYKSESILYATIFQFLSLVVLDAGFIFLIK